MRQTSIEKYVKERGLTVLPVDPVAVEAYRRGMERMQEHLVKDEREQAVLREKARRIVLF